jgi:Na+-transporting NADH:ubiquinone oxidoreductase subunit C
LGIPFANEVEAASEFAQSITEKGDGANKTWRTTIDGSEYIALQQSGAGLWGTITIILAASVDGERVRGIRVVAQNETPGLGGRIDEPWFLGQYEGERSPNGRISMRAGAEAAGKADTDKENGQVDGISGATRTSQAFASIVNAALERYKSAGGVQ